MRPAEVILASGSKYRKELLGRLLSNFECHPPDIDESSYHSREPTPERLAARLAREKSLVVSSRFPDALVIGSDQLVDVNGVVLGKPGSVAAAVKQLLEMSGRTHRLVTAVCILGPGFSREFSDVTSLTMRTLTSEEAERYVLRDQPTDCAGSYRIESLGISLFQRIETQDFTAIMGLPLIRLSCVLREAGLVLP